MGPQGPQGAQGDTGRQGEQGPSGNSVTTSEFNKVNERLTGAEVELAALVDSLAIVDFIESIEFVWIEPGKFVMGAPFSEEGRNEWDLPKHNVTLTRGFYLGKYEVTQGQWETVMGTRPWVRFDNTLRDNVQVNPNHPAVHVSWFDVSEFIGKLNDAAGKSIYRLPTEAEWEYAARAGTTTRWSFGDDESQLANYAWYRANAWDIGKQYAQPVGTKLPNPWGLYDMHGNVNEWCIPLVSVTLDSFRENVDPFPDRSDLLVLYTAGIGRGGWRGGDFGADAQYTRSANLWFQNQPVDVGNNSLGFRLVRTE